jgi:DNA-binding NarL/FixJ family response regulator
MGGTANGGSADVLFVDIAPDVVAKLQTTPCLNSFRLLLSTGQYGALQLASRLRPAVAVVNVDRDVGREARLVALLREVLPGLLVIATSEQLSPQTEAQAYARGATLCLPEPLDVSLLTRVIDASLRRRKGVYSAPAVAS